MQNISHLTQGSMQNNLHKYNLTKQSFMNSIISICCTIESKASDLHKCLNTIDPIPWLKRGWTQLKKKLQRSHLLIR